MSASALRWIRFNLVGGLGVGVQLMLLAFLNRGGRLPYLSATALAVEFTVLHNFAWHERFTWRDRSNEGSRSIVRRLIRFHASNGLVSIIGNILLMAVFAGKLRLPVFLANIFSIVICSITNFFLADRWVFAGQSDGALTRPSLSR